jgi:hypothetical protein
VKLPISKIVSGGQTGADIAALDFAIEHGIPYGGWCPGGRTNETGVIDPRYLLVETPSDLYEERTEWNVRDSDGTVIFTVADALIGGCKTTAEAASKHEKPWLHLAAEHYGQDAAMRLKQFVQKNEITILNVAGSRASREPNVGQFVKTVLSKLYLMK